MKPIFYTRHSINKDDIQNVIKALQSDKITQGSFVNRFEDKLKSITGARYAVVVNSGTAALHTAMFAAGIGVGDDVITTPLSFVATANCILYQGGNPVFADVNYETGLLNPKEVTKKIGKKTKAVITVDYAGQPSYLDELKKICKEHRLILIDDACHSLGAIYKGRTIGVQADITVFSFHPAKVITTGEGGAIVTDNKKFYERALIFRNHGMEKNFARFKDKGQGNKSWIYEIQDLGYNYRISDFQCALGISQLARLSEFIEKRTTIASIYTRKFKNYPKFKVPLEVKGSKSAWHLYPLRIIDQNVRKEDLFKTLQANSIYPQVHFIPIHTHPYYKEHFGYKWKDFPNAERFYEEEISLPLYPGMNATDLQRVIGVLEKV